MILNQAHIADLDEQFLHL